MIELRITNSAAVLLLTERMKLELEARKRNKLVPEWSTLNSLPFNKLLGIAEISAFDLICLLPADVLTVRNNLSEIITKAIRTLSTIYNRDEFNIYSSKRAHFIVDKIYNTFQLYSDEEKSFQNN